MYNIESILQMKLAAYQGRDKLRDLFDIVFIFNNYFNDLSEATLAVAREAFTYKGLEQYEFLIKDQQDEFINNDDLMEHFLIVWDKLGLTKQPEYPFSKSNVFHSPKETQP